MAESRDTGKRNAALEALEYVQDGMTLGIGTGSTAKYLIDALGDKVAAGWRLRGVPTSEETRILSEAAGIDIITPDETTRIDLAIDGADEADPSLNLIKGGGGALLREKIIANAADKFVVIADASKRVAHLGRFPLPVEIETFGWALTVSSLRRSLKDAGFENPDIEIRATGGTPFQTDGGNLIADCALQRITDPTALELRLTKIPGVVESGLFCGMADIVIYGDADGASSVSA